MTTQDGSRREWWRRGLTRAAVAVAMAVSLSVISITAGNPSSALGPVIALTPFGTNPTSIQGEPTSVSARGELVGVVDAELNRVAAIAFDDGDLEPAFAGRGISVTGNGCGVMWLDDSNVENQIIFYSDQCNQGNTRVFLVSNFDAVLKEAGLPTPARGFVFRSALSFDGNFAAIQLQAGVPGQGTINVVMHLDLRRSANGQPFAIPMPTQPLPGNDTEASFGLDISDDGTFVVVPVRIPFFVGFGSPAALGTDNRDLFIAGWRVGSNPIVVNADGGRGGQLTGSSAYPSTTRDGRFVSFASDAPLAGGESGRGPWVYVKEIGRSGFRLVSPANASAYYTSITSDGTQVAFGRSQSCQIGDLIEFQCPPFQIDVAFGATPGLTGAFQAETVSIGASGSISGEHHWPYLSGNGRYVAWESNAGRALTGNGQIDNEFHAFIRRRDPGLTVGDVAFGPVLASNSGTGTSTVLNTGRDTVAINSVAVTSGPFVVTGGSCGAGVTLGPGASCTVNLRFDASLPAQAVNGTLTVSETGFDAISASGRLTGTVTTTTTTSTTQPTVVNTTTTTTTTIAGQNPIPTVPPITLGTLPGEPVLSASPNPVDFGDAPVLIASDIRTVTVTNSGTGGGNVVSTIGGTNPADFALVGGTCRIGTLLPGRTCTLDYRMTATASGDRSAELVVTADDASATVDFLGVGRFEPRVAVTPATVTERGITTILGQGYPPGVAVTVRVDDTLVLTATPDDAGIFRIPISPLGQLDLGPHVVSVDDAPGLYEGPEAAFVVVLPTFSPQGPTGPAFNNNLLVSRG